MEGEDSRTEGRLNRRISEEHQRWLVVPCLRVERLTVANVLRDGCEDAFVAIPARRIERRVAQHEGEQERARGEQSEDEVITPEEGRKRCARSEERRVGKMTRR